MVFLITTRCEMHCSHCSLDCKPEGSDITDKLFQDFRKFIENQQKKIVILLSGGEPTLHHKWHEYASQLLSDGFIVMILSNGMFLDDENQVEKLLFLIKTFPKFNIQITHDSRFYPQKIDYKKAKKLNLNVFKEIASPLIPIGRAKKLLQEKRFEKSIHPKCTNPKLIKFQRPDFNLWDITLKLTLAHKACFPFIDNYGNIYAGETNSCQSIGTIYDDPQKISDNIFNLTCNKCI